MTAVSIILPALALVGPSGGAEAAAPEDRVIAVFSPQNRAGDSSAAGSVDQTLREGLSRHGRVLDPGPTRDALRRLRIRNGDRAAPELLRLLGQELGADWLVSSTLHDAERRTVPRAAVSARIYAGRTGELVWAGFRGASGLDRRTLLGLGGVEDLDRLAAVVVRTLLEQLQATADTTSTASGSAPGRTAIVPFAGATERRGTAHAETVTEAARARLLEEGVDLVSPNRVAEILRRSQAGRWGGVTAAARVALHESADAEAILTGAVEAYAIGGSEPEPNPRVAVAMRLLDAATGRIVWTGWVERRGADGGGPFGIGRVRSRGALAEKIVRTLAERLEEEQTRTGDHDTGR